METRGFFISLMMISNPQSIFVLSALTFAFFAINRNNITPSGFYGIAMIILHLKRSAKTKLVMISFFRRRETTLRRARRDEIDC